MFPPIPSWDQFHPIVVHFPIALLMVAPVLVILGLILYKHFLWFAISAFTIMALGVIGAFLAVASGEAAADLVNRTPEINSVIERHMELAETSRLVFLGLAIVFAGIAFGPHLLKRPLRRKAGTITVVVFLLVYSGGMLLLANTGYLGGHLVHDLGIRPLVSEYQQQTLHSSDNDEHEDESRED
ncbi:MAG: hypothetical protein J5J06_01515 [Phycisphaerae bacterium]|nr:hypothetical protein [Phycisphaerae bacterium]